MGEAKLTLNPRTLGKTAECTRSDVTVGLGIVQAIEKTSHTCSDAQCNTNPPRAHVLTLAAHDELRTELNHWHGKKRARAPIITAS